MKKISFLMMTLAAILLLASCSKKQSGMLIPDDAVVVMRFDVSQFSEKCGLSGDNADMKKWLEDQIKDSGLDKDMSDKLMAIVEDPTKSGLDLTEPFYFYVAGKDKDNVEAALVGTMASQGDLTDLLNALANLADEESVKENNDGVKYMDFGDSKLIYTNEWFFAGNADDIESTVKTLMKRIGGEGSLDGNEAFETMCDKDGVAQVLYLGSGMSHLNNHEIKKAIKDMEKTWGKDLKLEDYAIVADLELNKGETLLTSQSIFMSKAWKDYSDQYLKILKPISDEQVKLISGDGLSFFLNLDSKDLYSQVEKTAKLYDVDDQMLEIIRKVCDALAGTASFDLFDFAEDGTPKFTLYVGTKNADLIDLAKEKLFADDIAEEISDNEFSFVSSYDYEYDEAKDEFTKTPKGQSIIGYKNGQSFIAFNQKEAFQAPAKSYPASEIKGVGFYVRFNFDLLDKIAEKNGGNEVMGIISGLFDTAEAYCQKDGSSVISLKTDDKDKNLMEVVIGLAKDLME